jgi:tetratricopeptide (TPR) repeat protein
MSVRNAALALVAVNMLSVLVARTAEGCICTVPEVRVGVLAGAVFLFAGEPGIFEPAAGAKIVVHDAKQREVPATTTDESGSFAFPTLKPGQYTLDVSLEGAAPTSVSIRVGRKEPKGVAIRLDLARECLCGNACGTDLVDGKVPAPPDCLRPDSGRVAGSSAIKCATPGQSVDEAFFNLGLAYRAERKYRRAAASFKRALTIDPSYSHARDALRDVQDVVEQRSAGYNGMRLR